MKRYALWIAVFATAACSDGKSPVVTDTNSATEVIEPADTPAAPDVSESPDTSVTTDTEPQSPDEGFIEDTTFTEDVTSKPDLQASEDAEETSDEGDEPDTFVAPVLDFLCMPCNSNDDCVAHDPSGKSECIDGGQNGSFCGAHCTPEAPCPANYKCNQDQCVPENNECTCSALAIELKASTNCQKTNVAGTCTGERVCTDTGLTECSAAEPTPEVCDGQDNNCDKAIDNDISPAECTNKNEFGTCKGTTTCSNGNTVCDGPSAAEETCNNKDDNCNQGIDEGLSGQECTIENDVGTCKGKTLCANGQLTCEGAAASKEICDGLDNDCNASTDDGLVASECQLTNAFGTCKGTQTCAGVAGWQCDALTPAQEICNGKDDNCNGKVDENVKTIFYPDADGDGWGTGITGISACTAPPNYASKTGDCDDSNEFIFPTANESCNGIDDNCNGVFDEHMSGTGKACDGDDSDQCENGIMGCIVKDGADTLFCYDEAPSGLLEVCGDGLDNDCDGKTDEGAPGSPCDPEKVAGHISGSVFDGQTFAPIKGAKVLIKSYTPPQTVLTNDQGRFFAPVPKLGHHFLHISATNYTTAVRKGTLTSEMTGVADVFLQALDPAVHNIKAGEAANIKNAGNTVTLSIPEGALSQDAQVQMTWHPKSASLPGNLPNSSVWTSAVHLTPHGTTFKKPVEVRVKNKHGFPVGLSVPVGYFDPNTAQWNAHGKGVVESKEWIVFTTTHFSDFDANYAGGGEGGMNGGAGGGGSKGGGRPGIDLSGSRVHYDSGRLRTRHIIPGPTIQGVPRPMVFQYDSHAANPAVYLYGYQDLDVPQPVHVMGFEWSFEGQTGHSFFQPPPDGKKGWNYYPARIDAINGLGVALPTAFYPYNVTISNYFSTQFCQPEDGVFGNPPTQECFYSIGDSGDDPPGGAIPVNLHEVSFSFKNTAAVVNDQNSPYGAGWSVGNVMRIHKSPSDGSLAIQGGGTLRRIANVAIVTHVAGGGAKAGDKKLPWNQDKEDEMATDASVTGIRAIAFHPDGSLYFSQAPAGLGYHRIRRIDPSGVVTTVVNMSGQSGCPEDAAPSNGNPTLAVNAPIKVVNGMVFDDLGNLYFTDSNCHRVYRVDGMGTIVPVAGAPMGSGQPLSDDPNVSVDALTPALDQLHGLAMDSAGALFVTSSSKLHNRIMRIDLVKNTVSYVIGTGPLNKNVKVTYQCDTDGQAYDLKRPKGLVFTDNKLLIADDMAHRVWSFTPSTNTLCPIIGSGNSGTPKDPQVALEASVYAPAAIAVDSEQQVYLADWWNDAIWRLGTDGMLRKIAGGGIEWGTGSMALDSVVADPDALAVDPAGTLYYAEGLSVGKSTPHIRKLVISQHNDAEHSVVAENNDGTYTRTTLSGMVQHFDSQGFQTSAFDQDGNETTFEYTNEQQLKTIVYPTGYEVRFEYAGNTIAVKQMLPDGQVRKTTLTRDNNNNLVSVSDPDGTQHTYTYDTAHQLTSKQINGETNVEYSYENGQIKTVTIPGTDTGLGDDWPVLDEVRTYTSAQHYKLPVHMQKAKLDTLSTADLNEYVPELMATKTDGAGNLWKIEYDRFMRVKSTTTPLGHSTTYTRDAFGHPTRIERPDGSITLIEYDARGNAIKTSIDDVLTGAIDPISGKPAVSTITTHATYESKWNHPIREVDAEGFVTRRAYAESTDSLLWERRFRVKVTESNEEKTCAELGLQPHECEETSYSYSPKGRLLSQTSPNGHVMDYEYDARGNPTALISHPEPDTEARLQLEIDTIGRLTKVSSPEHVSSNGQAGWFTTYSYDTLDRIQTMSHSAITNRSYGYQSLHDCSSCNEEQPVVGLITDIQYGEGESEQLVYSRVGQLMKYTDRYGATYHTVYSSTRQPTHTIDPQMNVFTQTYDIDDRLIGWTDPDIIGTDKTLNSLGFASQAGSANDATDGTSYTVNKLGWITQVKDSEGRQVRYGYDRRSYLTQVRVGDAQTAMTWTFERDGAGDPTQLMEANGMMRSYQWAHIGDSSLLQKVIFDGDKANHVTYEYDDIGRQTGATISLNDQTVTTATSYTLDGLPKRYKNQTTGHEFSYKYNGLNLISELTGPGGLSVTYTYDSLGRLTTVAPKLGNGPVANLELSYAKGSTGKKTVEFSWWNGLKQTFNFTQNNHLATIWVGENPAQPDAALLERTYTHTGAGRLLTETHNDGAQWDYEYNAAGRLSGAELSNADQPMVYAFEYDGSGNRVSTTKNGVQTIYQYNERNQLLTSTEADQKTTYTYDGNGNMAGISSAQGTFELASNARNRLIAVTNKTSGQVMSQYTYTADNERSSASYGNQSHTFHTDSNALVEIDAKGNVSRVVIWAPGTQTPLFLWHQGEWFGVHTNARSAPVALTDSNGALAWKATYGPFGKILTKDHPMANKKPEIPIRLRGQWQEPMTVAGQALYFNHHRFYWPELGRFNRLDPVLVPASPRGVSDRLNNLYAYAMGDPINNDDPNGLDCAGRCGGEAQKAAGKSASSALDLPSSPLDAFLKKRRIKTPNTGFLKVGLNSPGMAAAGAFSDCWRQCRNNLALGLGGC